MNRRTACGHCSPILLAFCIAVPLAAGGWCVAGWRELSHNRDELRRSGATATSKAEMQVEASRLNNQHDGLEKRLAQLRSDLKSARRRQMPVTPQNTERMIFHLLNLAARCGVNVSESSRLDETAGVSSVPSAGRKQMTAFMHRFQTDRRRRPMVQIQAEAPYDAINSFLRQLESLPWAVTPVQFEIGQQRMAVQAVDDGDGAATVNARRSREIAGSSDKLYLTIILSL